MHVRHLLHRRLVGTVREAGGRGEAVAPRRRRPSLHVAAIHHRVLSDGREAGVE